MSQDNKKSFVMYQGDGSNNVFSVPMTKGKYGTISVAFVRRGLDQYEYNPDTWGLNGGLFAWDLSDTKVYTDTATPAIGATIYDQYGVDTGDTVTAVGGATITVNTNVYTRDTLHDVDENTVLTWTGNTLQIGDYIVIERTTTRTQPFEFQNNQKHIEKSDDNLERQIQEVADKVDNALLVDPTHTIDSNKMNPVEWMQTILRSVDKSVRGFRYLNGWLDYSLDDPNIADVDKTWTHLVNTDNIKAIREQSRIENNETIYYTEYLAQDGSWKTLSDPHKWDNMKLSDLADTDFTNLSAGNFIMFDGLKWKNVYSSATASWGTLIGDITAQTDLMNKFTEYVRTDGTSVMTAPLLMRATDDFKCAIAPYWDGVGFFKLNDNNSVTLMASIEYNSGFEPATTNTYNIGASARKWKNLYLSGKAYISTINNGYDLAVPAKSGTLATMGDVDLAANSGDQLTEKGVWYAKMYSATVAPSAENGTNYADFSQTDGQGNPIIVIYKRQNGAWVQDQTITPPAEYNGYVPVTSKIWDIVEQSGQQGGKVLWSHNQKTFTPSPLIISFKDIEITGNSTVVMPATPTDNSIPTKKYVDDKFVSQTYHPGLFAHEWDDHLRNDAQWLRADTFSWQEGSVYEAAYNHLVDDINNSTLYGWSASASSSSTDPTVACAFSTNATLEPGDKLYFFPADSNRTSYNDITQATIKTIYASDVGLETGNFFLSNSRLYYKSLSSIEYVRRSVVDITTVSETISGITVQYYRSPDGHKICPATEESNVAAIYAATGVAWYYIVDTANQRFKLPRTQYNEVGLRDTVGKYVPESLPNITATISGTVSSGSSSGAAQDGSSYSGNWNYGAGSLKYVDIDASEQSSAYQNDAPVQQRATQMYLYFYVGSFTQTAIENTAGLNAELFNGKVDLTSSWGFPTTTEDILTLGASGTTYTATDDGWFCLYAEYNSGTDAYFDMFITGTTMGTKHWFGTNAAAGSGRVFLPVRKGMSVTVNINGSLKNVSFTFVHAQKTN